MAKRVKKRPFVLTAREALALVRAVVEYGRDVPGYTSSHWNDDYHELHSRLLALYEALIDREGTPL